MTGERRSEAADHLTRARSSLQAARALLREGFFDDAASRAYYAAFHAASAVLMADGKTFRKHGGLLAAVHRDLVRPGAVPVETGRWLTWLYEIRAVGDYGETIHVGEKEARTALERAEQLLRIFETLLQP